MEHQFPTEPKKPEWKMSKSKHDRLESEKVRGMTLQEAIPSSCHRIAILDDRDNQLRKLLDWFDSKGLPMGSDEWALHVIARIRRLEDNTEAIYRMLNYRKHDGSMDVERLQQDLEHNRVMYAKRRPKVGISCDWCGWDGARPIGGGYAACHDCLPEKDKEENQPIENQHEQV